jgi:hypothetical protein
MKGRTTGIIILTAATAAAVVIAYAIGINPPAANVAGAFVSIVIMVIVTKIIKVDDTLFYSGLVFIFMASPLGSIIDLYRFVDPYDKIVHFISGFLLAAFGMFIIEKLLKRTSKVEDLKPFVIPMIFAACMFSSGGAGLWEIFEFLADKIAGGGMQRGMVDTVTDMIAGNIGALVYGVVIYFRSKKLNRGCISGK